MNQTTESEEISYYQKNKEKILARQKEYNQRNKEKVRAYQKEYYKRNKEKLRANQKERYKAQEEELLAYWREWRKANPEKVREQRRRQYAKNPESILATNRKYQHSKRNPDLTDDELKMVEHFYEQASRLNSIFGGRVFEVDHTVPLSKGGKHSPWNLQVVPTKWNRTKNNHSSSQWEAPFEK